MSDNEKSRRKTFIENRKTAKQGRKGKKILEERKRVYNVTIQSKLCRFVCLFHISVF